MEQKQINIYKFEELSEEIQEKVLNHFKETEEYYFLEDSLKDHLEEELEINKIKSLDETKLRYSLNCSQGDGLSFIGLFSYNGFIIKLEEGNLSNHYQHKYTIDFNIEYEDNAEEKEITETEETEIKEIFFNIMDKLEKIGYSYIEDALSDEVIKENIEINEYTFRSNGEIEHI